MIIYLIYAAIVYAIFAVGIFVFFYLAKNKITEETFFASVGIGWALTLATLVVSALASSASTWIEHNYIEPPTTEIIERINLEE